MLEEDALRFDAFLKENDEKVQEAIKHADTEAKSKQDKVRHKHTAVTDWVTPGWQPGEAVVTGMSSCRCWVLCVC